MTWLRVYSVAGGAGPGQLGPDRRGEPPVDGAADGRARLTLGSLIDSLAPARCAASRRSASIAVRPGRARVVGDQRECQHPPLASVTIPASELVPVNDPVLARSQPAGAASGVGVEEAVGQRAAAAGDRQQVHQRPQLRLIRSRPRR